MKKHWNRYVREPLLRTMIGVPWFGPVVMAVLVSLIINVLTTALVQWGGLALAWLVVAVAVLLATAFVVTYDRAEHRRRSQGLGPIDLPHPEKHVGLIFLFSREDTLREALAYHAPVLTHAWLLVTPELQSKAAEAVQHHPNLRFAVESLPNLYDTRACYQTVLAVYQNAARNERIDPKRIISDITGGTKPMTMGMILACVQGGYPIEHVPTRYDSDGNPIGPLPPIQISLQGGFGPLDPKGHA